MARARSLALVALALGAAAPAQLPAAEKFLDLEWSTLPDGSLGILPNPAVGELPGVPPFALFPALLGQPDSLWVRLCRITWHDSYKWLVLLAPGACDGASTTLADQHLRVRGLASDGDLLALIDGARLETAAFQRGSASLDRLLAVRAAGERHLRLAREKLEVLTGETGDPFLVRAARETAAELGGLAAKVEPPHLPPWRDAWSELPSSAALVLCVDDTRLPAVAPVGAALQRWTARGIRAELDGVGVKPPRTALAGAQMLTEWPGMLGYELARRFGNWRVHRTTAWLGAHGEDDVAFGVRLDGVFAPDALAKGLSAENIRVRSKDGRLEAALPDRCVLTASADSLRLERDAGAAAGDALAEELAAAGAGGRDALWLHRRAGVPWPTPKAEAAKALAWMTRFSTFTLRASFDPELDVSFTGRLADAEDKDVEAWMKSARAWAVAAGLGEHLATERQADRVAIRWSVPGTPGAKALVRAIDAAPHH